MASLPAVNYISNAARTTAEVQAALEATIETVRQSAGQNSEATSVLAADAFTPTRFSHAVDTEGAAATDNLANIVTTNLPDGSLLLIRPVSAARVVTVKHNAGGAGQIALANGVDKALTSPTTSFLLLRRNGANWEEVPLGGGAGGAIWATASGTNAITLTPSAPVVRAQFPSILFVAANANTAAVTVNDGNGSVNLRSQTGAALGANAIVAGTLYQIAWDGTQYRIVGNPVTNASSFATGGYTATGGETTVTVSEAVPAAGAIEFFRNNVRQRPGTDYSASGTTSITLTVAATNGETFWWLHSGTTQFSGGSAGNLAFDPFTGNGSQTAFTLSQAPSNDANLAVYVSGIRQRPTVDYTTSGNTLTMAVAPANGVPIYAFSISTLPIGVPSNNSVGPAQIQANAVTPDKLARSGTAGQVLTSNGAGADPSYQTISPGVPTGVVSDYVGTAAPSGWVLLDGRTIGSASSGATNRANADTQALYELLWNSMANTEAPVSSGRGASAAADFAANKTITIPDARGRVIAGRDNMGGTNANRLTSGGSGITGTTLGVAGGTETHTLTTAQMPSHTHSESTGGGGVNAGMGCGSALNSTAGTTTGSAGSGNAHQNTQPTLVLNKIIKL